MASSTKKQSRGTVTVLFTDLVDSTQLLDQLGDDAVDLLRRKHFKRLREVVRSFKGQEVKSLGDGLMVVFTSAFDAAACAIAIQRSSIDDEEALRVRVGMHTGEPTWEDEDLFGTAVVVAKRLCDRAVGGGRCQISAGDGDDLIFGYDGADDVDGGPGADVVWGGPAADSILGSTGNDEIHGEAGDDALDGGPDSDLLDGGDGTDSCANGESTSNCEA